MSKQKEELVAIKKELVGYIAAVDELEDENESLKNALKAERVKTKEIFLEAKQSWRTQAIAFAEKERKKVLDHQSNSSEIYSVRNELRALENTIKIFNGLKSAFTAPILLDFDIQDCHIAIHNPTKEIQNMSNYYIKFSNVKLKYNIFNDTKILPGASASVWWGKNNEHMLYPNNNCFFFNAAAADNLQNGEIAELYNDSDTYVAKVTTNVITTPPSASTDPSPTKRRRIDVSSGIKGLQPILLGRQQGALQVESVKYSKTGTGYASVKIRNNFEKPFQMTDWKLYIESGKYNHIINLPSFDNIVPGGAVTLYSSADNTDTDIDADPSSEEGEGLREIVPDLKHFGLGLGIDIMSSCAIHLVNSSGRRVSSFDGKDMQGVDMKSSSKGECVIC